ncbi:MAG: response regulator transcription factor [Lachnospiraceae bacterium]
MKLLVVEDERDLNHIIVNHLKDDGYNVDACYDGEYAVDLIESIEYDGIILDVMLPKKNGFDVLKDIRSHGIQTPVLFLTARGETEDVVRGLDLGADEYMTKPFVFDELMARVRVLTRKKTDHKENIYRCGNLTMDENLRKVKRGEKELDLSPREYAILLYMIRNQNIILTREQIETNVWDFDYDGTSNIVDVYIRYLRRKVDNGFDQKLIHTIRGVGYKLSCED